MKPRVGIVTQARTSSTRLPGKVLMRAAGTSLLEHHLNRLATARLPVLVATTASAADDAVAEIAGARGHSVHRGSELDVLSRFDDCARANGLEVVVRVTSDCPLIDGDLVAVAVREWVAADDPFLYLSNCLRRTFPRGFDFEVFSAEALHEAALCARTPSEREHVTPYLYTDTSGRMTLRNIELATDESRFRVTVDTAEDLTLVSRLVEDHHAHLLDCAAIIAVLKAHPELAEVNGAVVQKSHLVTLEPHGEAL